MNIPKKYQDKTDLELVEFAKKDPEYFGLLMARYEEPLSRYIKRISYFSEEDRKDILQEVFIKVYKNINDYDISLKFSSWIYRITRNHTIDQIRKLNGKPAISSLDNNELANLVKSSIHLEKDFSKKDFLRTARQIINTLPLKYKEVLVLKFLEEKNYEEMMDILRKPKGSIATLVRRGRKLLLEKMKDQGIYRF